MKQCRNHGELIARHGMRSHRVSAPAMEILHYPLGIHGGTLYSIHVAIVNQDAPTAYMHVEPTSLLDTVAALPWWRFW